MDSYRQISYGTQAGGGGGCDMSILAPSYSAFSYVQAWDISNFEEGETVEITIYRPDGSVYLQQTKTVLRDEFNCTGDDFSVGPTPWVFTESDPAGIWSVEFKGENGHTVTYQTLLSKRESPWFISYCRDEENILVLDGFKSNEKVTVALVEAVTGFYDLLDGAEVEEVHSWEVNVNERGQLIVTFSNSITRSDLRYLTIIDSSGEMVWTNTVGIWLFQQGASSFSECNSKTSRYHQIVPPFIGGDSIFEGRIAEWEFEGQQGQNLSIKMEHLPDETSPDDELDAFLQLLAPDGTLIAKNDDSEHLDKVHNTLDAYFEITLPSTGVYTIVASSVNSTSGEYKLTVEYISGEQAVLPAIPSSEVPKPTSTPVPTYPPDICSGLMPPRLIVGAQGRVIDSEPNNIRQYPWSTEILGQIPSGAVFNVLEGPECPSGSRNVWWRVEYKGVTGWTAESGSNVYWLAPVE